MEFLCKRLSRFLLVFFLLVICASCTELGDLIVIKFTITHGKVALKELDQDFLPKKNWGSSPKCLTRRSQVGIRQYIGICIDDNENSILIYRVFELKFHAKERGVTKELLESEGYRELRFISDNVEQYLRSKGIRYVKSDPYYQDFGLVHEKFQLTR